MEPDEIIAAVRKALDAAGGKTHKVERDLGLKQDRIRNILGRDRKPGAPGPGAFHLAEVCESLGLEFYVGPQREVPPDDDPPLRPGGTARVPVADVRLTQVIVALEDAWELPPPHKRSALAEAIIGNIELSCPSEEVHPGRHLAAF